MFDRATLPLLDEALAHLERGFDRLPAFTPPVDEARAREVLLDLAERLRDNYPYAHPLYAGQMLTPPHAIARLAYSLSLFLNPNNHALDGGRATSALEREAVAALAAMIGFETHLGHLTGGGTAANLEALWIAGRLRPGEAIVASRQAHYTHARLTSVLGLAFEAIDVDAALRMDVGALAARLERGGVGTVVVTMGTTGVGAVDPLPEILALRDRHGFRVHVDAAYGGYFGLVPDALAPDARAAFARLAEADSFVVDPHKHGLQPYGCGCVLFRDPSVGRFYKHDSPYTYFTSDELHLGEISLECSRPGAAAAALWATQRAFPPVRDGAFAAMLASSREAALDLAGRLASSRDWIVPLAPELDIVVWAPRGASASAISEKSRRVFHEAAARDLHLALVQLPSSLLAAHGVLADEPRVTCLRSCLMKAEHAAWIDRIAAILGEALAAAS